MSSDSLEEREALLESFAREVRQLNGLSASFFRAAAARVGMNVTDLQVTDILDINGPSTAGQLAELMGLTTGAITGMIDRLEKAKLVRRERDPNDGRRVIVTLTQSQDALREAGPIFDSVGRGWDQIASSYSDEELTFLLEFLRKCNTVSRQEISRLRETPADDDHAFAAPLEGVEKAELLVYSAMSRLGLFVDSKLGTLFQGQFEGTQPNIKVSGGSVSLRYPQRMWLLNREQRSADLSLSSAVPWSIAIHGGASEIKARLDGLDLIELEIKGGMSSIYLDLPVPQRVVPVRISGGASEIEIRRPSGAPARAHLKGWASELTFDDQYFTAAGGDMRLNSSGFQASAPHYDIEIASSASSVRIGTR